MRYDIYTSCLRLSIALLLQRRRIGEDQRHHLRRVARSMGSVRCHGDLADLLNVLGAERNVEGSKVLLQVLCECSVLALRFGDL